MSLLTCREGAALELTQGVVAEEHVFGAGPGLGPRLPAILRMGDCQQTIAIDRLAARSGVLLAHEYRGHHIPHLCGNRHVFGPEERHRVIFDGRRRHVGIHVEARVLVKTRR